MKRVIFVLLVVAVLCPGAARGQERDREVRADQRRADVARRWDDHYTPHYVPRGREFRELPNGFMRLFVGGLEFFFWEGMYYREMGDRYVVVAAPIGAVVTALPAPVIPIIVEGVPYYTINGVTYMLTSYGYQVVPPPQVIVVKQAAPPPQVIVVKSEAPAPVAASATTVAAAQPATPVPVVQDVAAPQVAPAVAADDSYTVNIPNSKGTYTAVALKRNGNGFVGPQGEYYSEFPKVEQLKLMYGK